MKIPYYLATLAFVLATTPAMPSNANQRWSEEVRGRWWKQCVKKNSNQKPQGRVVIQRYGISVEVPDGMQLEHNKTKEEILITSNESIAQMKCVKEARTRHGQFYGGVGSTNIGIVPYHWNTYEESPRFCGDKKYIVMLGSVNTLYMCLDPYINVKHPLTGKKFAVYFHRIKNEEIMGRFIRSAKVLR